jgi:cationic peptide transport system substrate-binding protein
MDKRKAYYTRAMNIIYEEAPLLAIAHSKRFQARSNDVQGKILSNFGGVSFHEVTKASATKNADDKNAELNKVKK